MVEYIRQIREKLGHIPIVVCAASVLIVNERNEVLLQLRNDNHRWAYPGGAVEVDETVEDAAMREMAEETGLRANAIQLFGVFSGKDMHHIYPNGDEVSNVDIVFLCTDYSGDVRPDYDESNELRFFPIDHLPSDISTPCMRALQDYAKTKGRDPDGTL